MARKRRPTIFLDEHISSKVGEIFRDQGLRVIEISKSKKWRGRAELEFLGELYRENGIFITNDWEFIQAVLDSKPKHAGIIHVGNMDSEERILYAKIVAGFVWGSTYSSPFNLRNQVIYPAYDGLHVIEKEKDELIVSWDWLASNV